MKRLKLFRILAYIFICIILMLEYQGLSLLFSYFILSIALIEFFYISAKELN